MPEQGHPGSAPLSSLRASRIPLCALMLLAGCGGGDPTPEPDSGLVAIAKDGALDPADGGSAPDAADATAGLDAASPDAAPLPDRDGDGIPDALDPQPDATNRVLFEDDFSTARGEWLFTSSAMAASRGVLAVQAADGIVREGWLGPQPNWTDTLVRTSLRVVRRGTSNDEGAGRAALIVRVQQVAPDRYLACGIDVRRQVAFLAEHNGGNTAGRILVDAPLPDALGSWHTVAISSQSSRIRCLVDELVMEVTNSLYSSGSAGLRSYDAAFEADDLVVNAL